MWSKRLTIGAVLLAAWIAFAAWQYQRFRYERYLIGDSMRQTGRAVMSALVGGIQSHRRVGPFFEVQVEGMLGELTASEHVLAAAIVSSGGQRHIQAGEARLLESDDPIRPGDALGSEGFRLIERFDVEPGAQGGGFGGGRGAGRWQMAATGPFAEGGTFYALLLLDRTRHDQLVRRAAWSCVFICFAGGMVMASVAAAWRASVRLVAARGLARVLELETRHWRDLGQAAAGLAHETRNPLGVIRGWTQRLAAGEVDPAEHRQRAQTMVEECDRVTARINQFLAFARPCEPELSDVDVCGLAAELKMILQPDLEDKGVELVCRQESPPGRIRADRELLRQALFNLVQNAIHFAPPGDAITILVSPGGGGQRVVGVADRGPGVDSQTQPLLFTPYFTTRAGGTGLGLAIVRRIALAHGWRACYEPRSGGGASFTLEGIHASDETEHPDRG